MYEIERLVTILKPTQKFHDWLQTTSSLDKALTLEDLRSDCTALLLPTFETADEADDYLRKNIEEIFGNECETWCEDEACWPELSYDLFHEFFDIEHHSMVFDMVDDDEEDAEDEDYDEDDFEEDEEDEDDDK
jgi:hypothetical protein